MLVPLPRRCSVQRRRMTWQVANLQNAGAIMLAKTNMGEFAISPLESRVSHRAAIRTQHAWAGGHLSVCIAKGLRPAGLLIWGSAESVRHKCAHHASTQSVLALSVCM